MAVALAVSGCAVRLIGDYDDAIDKGITDVQQRAELYFAKLLSTPDTAFDQTFYNGIDASLAVLKSRASSLPKYDIIVGQVANLKKQFDDLQQLDKGRKRPLENTGWVTDAQSAIAVSVESILKLELGLRRGAPAPPTQK